MKFCDQTALCTRALSLSFHSLVNAAMVCSLMTLSTVLSFDACAETSAGAAGHPDQATQTATQQSQDLLRNSAQREKSLTTPEAKAADKQAKDLMGSDTQGLYELAADILPTIINDSGGDPIKLQASIDQLMKNPQSFSSKLSPDQLKKLQDLAKKVEARQPSSSAQH